MVLMVFGEKMVRRTIGCYRDSPRYCGSNTKMVIRSFVIVLVFVTKCHYACGGRNIGHAALTGKLEETG